MAAVFVREVPGKPGRLGTTEQQDQFRLTFLKCPAGSPCSV
ncbi:hypothetical protein P4W12_30755 [Bacillus thuringiensis]|nr:hypothetical protein [Bacillus thuringiensis]